MIAAARTEWPDLSLDDALFVRHVAARVAPRRVEEGRLLERAGDLFLACACLEHVPRAIAAFDRRCLAAAPGYLSRFGDHALVADLVQKLREKLLVGDAPRLGDYSGEGSLEAWVRVIA